MSFTSRRDERSSSTTEVPDRPVSDDPGTPDTPLELDSGDWKATVKRTVREIKDDRIPFAAAGMAFYFFLAIFPAMIALIGILGLVDVDAGGLVESIRTSLPGGAGDTVAQAVSRANSTSDAASLTATIFGLLVALWSASSGMAGLQSGLNIAYDVEHDRKFIGKRAVALLLLVATAALGIVPSPFFTFGDSTALTVLGWVFTVAAVMLLFSIFYAVAPNRGRPSWQWVTAGGVVGAVVWIAGSLVFGWYVTSLSSYSRTYGSLGGVIVLILWLYLSSLAVLVGGELNAELERQADRTSNEGEGTPRAQEQSAA
jgi:membrane protein